MQSMMGVAEVAASSETSSHNIQYASFVDDVAAAILCELLVFS